LVLFRGESRPAPTPITHWHTLTLTSAQADIDISHSDAALGDCLFAHAVDGRSLWHADLRVKSFEYRRVQEQALLSIRPE
jgi:hypothetical protein